MKLRFLFLFTIITSAAFSQNGYKKSIADAEYSKEHYAVAQRLYEEILSVDSLNEQAQIRLAECYRRLFNYPKAEEAYRKLAQKKGTERPQFYFYYAEALANNKKYEESKLMYHKFESLSGGDARVQNYIQSYRNIDSLHNDSAAYSVGLARINSNVSDFSPMYYKNGLVFCSGRRVKHGVRRIFSYDQSAYLDLYYVPDTSKIQRKKGNDLLHPDHAVALAKKNKHHDFTDVTSNDSRTIGSYMENTVDTLQNSDILPFDKSLNHKHHEGPLTFFKGDDSVIFTRNSPEEVSGNKGHKKIKVRLYSAVRSGEGWTHIRELPFNEADYSTGHPALSPDNKKLYFISDRPGGFGGTDIYVVDYVNGVWGQPVNLGRPVNTEGNEMFPYIDNDGNLYFSSNGHGGLGGLDIFFYQLTAPDPQKPRNLGAPLNSSADDFGLIVDKEKHSGYFSSNRRRGGTDDDIYFFTYNPHPDIQLEGLITDEQNNPLGDSRILIVQSGDSAVTNLAGSFHSVLKEGNQYDIILRREGFREKRETILTHGIRNGKLKVNYKLEKEPFNYMEAKVSDFYADSLPQEIALHVKNLKTGKTEIYNTDRTNTVRIGMDENSDYEVIAYAQGKKTANMVVTSWGRRKGEVINTNITFMQPDEDCEELRKKFYIENIYYGEAKYDIPKEARETISKIIKMMKKYPEIKLVISSHTDSKSTFYYNEVLSQMRTQSVYEYLVSKGVDKSRLMKEYYGENYLVNHCTDSANCPEDMNRLNRRTEFFVIRNNRNITKDCQFFLYDSIANTTIDKQVLGNVFFKYNGTRISRYGKRNLEYVARFLYQHPTLSVYASSHTDCKGAKDYNAVLSEKRLNACARYLVKKGLDQERIKGESFGESKPFNRCVDGTACTPEQHLVNRRVQFSVLIK